MKKFILLAALVLLSGSSLLYSISEVSQNNFDLKVVQSKIPVIVQVYADACGACKKVKSIFDALAEEMNTKVTFVTLNLDKEVQLVERYKVEHAPTLLIFKNGDLKETIVEVDNITEEILKNKIEKVIG